MNASYLYDIFETTRKHKAPDLTIGLAMLKTEQPIPDDLSDEAVRQFLGRHYEALSKAYRTGEGSMPERATRGLYYRGVQ